MAESGKAKRMMAALARNLNALWEGEAHNEGNKMRARQAAKKAEEERKKREAKANKVSGGVTTRTDDVETQLDTAGLTQAEIDILKKGKKGR